MDITKIDTSTILGKLYMIIWNIEPMIYIVIISILLIVLIVTSKKSRILSIMFNPIALISISLIGLIFIGITGVKTLSLIAESLLTSLFIAGIIGIALSRAEFKEKFAKLLYLSSDYLKNLSEKGKKEFFVSTLKKAYEFSDYGIEDEFAILTTKGYLPAFEDQYKSNHFIHRTFKPYNHDKTNGLENGITVCEEQGWRTHYPKNQKEQIRGGKRTMNFRDYKELYRRFFYSFEVWMKKVEKEAIEENIDKTDHTRCGIVKISVNKKIDEEEFCKAFEEIESLDFNEMKNFKEESKKFFYGDDAKLGIEVIVYTKNGERYDLNEPEITLKHGKKILLSYKIDGETYASIKINLSGQMISIDTNAKLNKRIAKNDYHFVQFAEFYNYYSEPFVVVSGVPTKSIIIDALFEGMKDGQKVITDVMYLAHKGENTMIKPVKNDNHYAAKFSGWFFQGHGVVFSYRIVDQLPCKSSQDKV
jgi:hypothetical protein